MPDLELIDRAKTQAPIITASFELAELILATRTPAAIISIGDPGESRPSGMESHFCPKLRLEFSDILIRFPDQNVRPPERMDMIQAVDFIKEHQPFTEEKFLLVHCSAGISRSTAIGLVAWCIHLGAGKEARACWRLYKENRCATPNMRMVKFAEDILQIDICRGIHMSFPNGKLILNMLEHTSTD